MNGRAWVVEVRDWDDKLRWRPMMVVETRADARYEANDLRHQNQTVRVRQYIRQQETRP
jgi:hypothetical protein